MADHSTLTFGFGMVTAQHAPADPRTNAEIYEDLIALSCLAEELGFDSVWLSEHHFVDDGYMPSLLPVAAAVAARTTRIRVATGVLVAPLHDPIRLAEDAATVDLLSRGRLLLGLGAGYRDEEFAGFGRSKERLGSALDHTISVLRAAWADEGSVQISPESQPVIITPKPHRPAGPPIWLGSRTPPGIRRAARRADGLLAARVTPDEFREQVALLVEETQAVGRSVEDMSVGVHCPVFAWPEGDAWSLLEPHIYYSEWKYKDMGSEPYAARSAPRTQPPITPETAQKLSVGALVGSPEQVAERIAEYATASGDVRFEFIPRLYWPGMDPQLQREALRVFAEQVMPLLRAV